MANKKITDFTELTEGPAIGDFLPLVDVSDTTDAPTGTTKKDKAQHVLGNTVNIQTGTTYSIQSTDFRKLITHSNAGAVAYTLPQAGASFPADWFCFVHNRGAGAVTITPTTSTIDGAATLVLNQGEGALIVSDGSNYFTMRGKAAVGVVAAPANATYITQVAESGLSAEQALAALATGILKSTTTTGVVSIADVNDISSPVAAADSGSTDTYVATLSPVPTGYVTGAHYRFKANTANTGACTINFNSLGAKTIKKAAGGITTDLADNDIRAGQWVDLVYDGTNMQMQSTSGNAAGGGGTNPTSTVIPYNNAGSFADSPLIREDANTVAQRNSTTAQTLNIYKTFTDASNYERLRTFINGTPDFVITTENLGTGTLRGLIVGTNSNGIRFDTSGHALPTTDAALNLGSSARTWASGFINTLNTNIASFNGFGRIDTNGSTDGAIRIRPSTGTTGGTFLFPANTPAQITGNQNNYDPGSLSYFQRWSSDASRNITGMTAGNQNGQIMLIVNVGTQNIVLQHENASSTAGNRFLCSTAADITLSADQAADLVYDSTTARWRVFKRN